MTVLEVIDNFQFKDQPIELLVKHEDGTVAEPIVFITHPKKTDLKFLREYAIARRIILKLLKARVSNICKLNIGKDGLLIHCDASEFEQKYPELKDIAVDILEGPVRWETCKQVIRRVDKKIVEEMFAWYEHTFGKDTIVMEQKGKVGLSGIQMAFNMLLKEYTNSNGKEKTKELLKKCGWTDEMINNVIKMEE